MRGGTNPEKLNFKKIHYKLHRVVIPVYVPNDNNDYFKNLDAVFYASVNSLLKIIDSEKTNITIINNNSKIEVTEFIDNLVDKWLIDKHVRLKENYVRYMLFYKRQERVMRIYNFADVFFFPRWRNEVLWSLKNLNMQEL